MGVADEDTEDSLCFSAALFIHPRTSLKPKIVTIRHAAALDNAVCLYKSENKNAIPKGNR